MYVNKTRTENREYLLQGDFVNKLLDDVIDYFTRVDMKPLNLVERGMKSREDFLREVREYLKHSQVGEPLAGIVLERFRKFLWSYDILDELINDESISDIKVLDENHIRIKRYGKRMTSPLKFRSKEAYRRFVDRVVIKNRTNLSDLNAVQNFTDKTTNPKFILRFNITTEFVNSVDTPYLHIRKIAKQKNTLADLIKMGMLSGETADWLRREASLASGILFTGKGASGKTTLMNALLDCIPEDYSGLVIQENEELFSNTHPDLMFQHVVSSKGEGKIRYDLKDLARNGLLTDLDYFIIGEIKGGEALYFLNAAYTGHKCWASVHGASSTEGLNKLADYVKYESDYSREDALHMLCHITTVVFLENFKVREISQIDGWDHLNNDLKYKKIL
ncbi:Flp pilus assembly complex ATPase component TadA [Lachnospiraceae bacterium ASD3451]|uniref:ATPase, T2SS/T4P/T4SS family n=1 Tax=Diplocloster agilis TaxID=2850323 RepID=UPI001DE216E6|nr:ATPase, T2SS/T4P/T4SS family [Diplocloster agilis]MBU9742313.1 Flp pilus assembly complex ATPase component TadA [Diplocloster agilis]